MIDGRSGKAVTDGHEHTADYASCWTMLLGCLLTSRQHMRWPGLEQKKSATWRPEGAPHQLPHGNLFQATVLKSTYYTNCCPGSRTSLRVSTLMFRALRRRGRAEDGVVARLPYVGENGYKNQEAVVALAGAKATWPETAASRL